MTQKLSKSAYLGNLFEHYDTALFSFLSPFLAPLIFPEKDPLTALILTYAVIPLGMLIRPLGSLVFGYIGDVYGRKRALFLTLAGMAVVSGCISLTPTYLQIGIMSPILFCLGRILQNFFASGETMGGAIFLLENEKESHPDVISSFYNASTMGGIILASLGVFLLSYFNVIESCWRWLYGFGCITACFGLQMRRGGQETPFSHSFIEKRQKTREMLRVCLTYRKELLWIAVSSGFSYAGYSLSLVLINGLLPLISQCNRGHLMGLNTALLVFDFCMLPFFGWLSSRISREKMMLGACLTVIITAAPLLSFLEKGDFFRVTLARISLVLLGVAFSAPFHAWVQGLVPRAHRYVVISLGYALGTQILGGPTTVISLWLFRKTGIISSVAWYWLFLAVATGFVMFRVFRRKALILNE